MKKFYSTMAVAVAMSFCASAQGVTLKKAADCEISQMSEVAEMSLSPVSNGFSKAPMKSVDFTSVEDLYGVYYLTMQVPLEGQPEGFQDRSIKIGPSDQAGCVTLVGLLMDVPVTAQVDAATKTLTVKKQLAFTHPEDGPVYVTPMKRVGTPGNSHLVEAEQYVLSLAVDGVRISSRDEEGNQVDLLNLTGPVLVAHGEDGDTFGNLNTYLALPVFQGSTVLGYYGLSYCAVIKSMDELTAEKLPLLNTMPAPFKYVESEWFDRGTAMYTDGFLAPMYNQTIPAYSVKVKQNSKNPNLVIAVDPYGKDTPWADFVNQNQEPLNCSTTPGYVMFDFTDPTCVSVMPMVYSGFSETAEYDIYFLNSAGQMVYLNGYSIDEAKDSYELLQIPLPAYDKDNKVLRIQDPGYTVEYMLFDYNQLTDNEGNPLPCETVVEFDEDVLDLSAVEGVEADTNAPAKYYNLQGMEVKNPVAGELVIVKKGAKTYKTIAK